MKIEYLLIKSNDDFCSNPEQFKYLLRSNKRIAIDGAHITLSGVNLDYTLSSQNVTWKRSREVVFSFTVSTDGEHVKILEEFDRLLHRINDKCGDQFKINTIWDDVSIYYLNKLYPSMIETENLLRKLIYSFMIKTAGSSWFSNSVPSSVKDAIRKTAEKNHLEDPLEVDQLYLADFSQLGRFFFEKYATRSLDQKAIQELRTMIEAQPDTKIIADFLEPYEERSNWERYFSEKIEVEQLDEKWKTLYGYRNCVAHAKRLGSKDYEKAMELIDELTAAFKKGLDHIKDVELTEDEAEVVQEVAKKTISGQSRRITDMWQEYPIAVAGISKVGAAVAGATLQVDVNGLSTGISKFADEQQKLMNPITT